MYLLVLYLSKFITLKVIHKVNFIYVHEYSTFEKIMIKMTNTKLEFEKEEGIFEFKTLTY